MTESRQPKPPNLSTKNAVTRSIPKDAGARLKRMQHFVRAFDETRQPALLDAAIACMEPLRPLSAVVPELAFILGMIESRRQNWAAARDAYEQAIGTGLDSIDRKIQSLNGLTQALIQLGAFERALEAAQDHVALRPFDHDALFQFGGILCMLGRHDDAIAVIDQAQRRYPELIMRRPVQFASMQADAVDRGLPAILVNTQFKSGSMFIRQMLCDGLHLPWCYITFPPFTRKIVPRWLEVFASGGAVCQEHLLPDEESLRQLSQAGINHFIVHIRDPRQAMISAIHHVEKRRQEVGIEGAFVRLSLPGGFENWPMARRVDHYLEHAFSREARWVGGWSRIHEEGEFAGTIRLTKYEDFKRDTHRYFAETLEFFGIPRESFDWSVLDAGTSEGRLHFRKGSSTEWMDILTLQQKAKAERLMADAGAVPYL